VCGGKTPCFSNIQSAINSAPTGETVINVTNQTYLENLLINSANTTIILKGGWDVNFTNRNSITTVKGTLEISDGTIIPDNLIIQP
jgi:pectin methylesterase-like acyl-CoA thioesterase